MHTEFHHRRAGLFAAVVSIAVLLPLSAAGSETTPAADGTVAQVATATPIADAGAVWAVLQKLPAHDVEVLHASFSPEVRADLAAIVRSAAATTAADG